MKAAVLLAGFFVWAARELANLYKRSDEAREGEGMLDEAERILFAELIDGGQVVRYDGGEWWLEYPYNPFLSGRSVSLDGAVALASGPGVTVHLDRRGGGAFYDALRRYIAEHNQ